jgi:mutator protein MutT
MVKKYSVLVNGAVFLNNQVLIIKRSEKEKHQAGKWCLPGGKMELNNAIYPLQKTVQREIKEEIGLIVNPETIIYSNVFQHSEDDQLTLAIVFICRHKSGKARPLEDTDEVKWIKEIEIDKFKFTPNVKNYIKETFKYAKRNRS